MANTGRQSPPFSLRIFVADGDPDGLRFIERSNWIGKAVVFPRALYPTVKARDEFNQAGVYLILGPRNQGEGEKLYIGEGDPVSRRLDRHYAEKDFWTRSVFFVARPGDLNKAHIKFLESRLIGLARAAKRMPLDNINNPAEPTLSEADRAYMEVFLQNILGMLPVLGINAFEQSGHSDAISEEELLHCSGRGVSATGFDSPKGFVVRAGSLAAVNEVESLKEHCSNVCKLREDLVMSGVLILQEDKFRFTQDYTFASPSLASSVVLARSSNGRTAWKTSSGQTLKSVQQAQAMSPSDKDDSE